ncbi:MAG TPA: hypothetical protein GXZ60_08795, partial [Intrasporangiaceae bacterium]|nr:hypothetical protein [Intrasporangiaceae bacterium]
MFGSTATARVFPAPAPEPVPVSGGGLVPVGTAELQQWLARLALPSPADGDADRIDRLRVLEQVKNAICAAQAAETLTFNTSQRDAQVAAGYAP